MNSTDVRQLRARLAARLRNVIRNESIERKELVAFDLIMNRRGFLKAMQLATVSALATAGLPPTAWGRRDPDLKVCPQDVGLTDLEQASVGVATQLIVGTELFQDTIYAQPVVSPTDIFSHGIIEGARPLLRLQSDLEATDPDELQFLDQGWHYGPTEVIQLEQTSGSWELVHYHHPWGPRNDGARTDSLLRRVIMDASDGLTNPTKILTSTATLTNKFKKNSSAANSGFLYLVYVEQGDGVGENFVMLGVGDVTTAEPWSEAPIYPVRWEARPLSEIGINEQPANYRSADKITREAYGGPNGAYRPDDATDQIVLYYTDRIYILNIYSGVPGYGALLNSVLSYPPGAPDARVVHSDFQVGTGYIKQVVLASNAMQSNGDWTYTLHAIGGAIVNGRIDGDPQNPNRFGINTEWTLGVFRGSFRNSSFTVPAASFSQELPALDYSTARNVQGLYVQTPGNNYHVKLANFAGFGVVAFVLTDDGSTTPTFHLAGHFPIAFPDLAGLGEILNFSGGVSKFGGLRFLAVDEDSNLFLMRQRRADPVDSPYAPPIYGQFDAQGQPITTFTTTKNALPATTAATSNLHDLDDWIGVSTAPDVNSVDAHNFLLSVALAFATDETSQAQGIWLGSGFKAAYAPVRYAHDSSHVVVKEVQSGSTNIFGVFNAFKNPVDKTWRYRQLATQMLVSGPGESESGDHYQATFTPANAYGKTVSLLSSVNANLQIEVRSDSPITVTDDTHNLYYDIDRYTSFMAEPDPSTGRLSVVTPAENFSQVLYARLVDTSGLQPSVDEAMLESTNTTLFPWVQANLAAQAQARMANSTATATLGATLGIADTSSYISEASLKESYTANPWNTRSSFGGSDSNYQGIANYLNTSGRNIATATAQNTFNAFLRDSTVDPLTSVTLLTSDSSNPTTTTTFDYMGSQVVSISAPAGTNVPVGNLDLGSFWKSISHALHDALHWLQHADDELISELSSGVQLVTSEVESVAVTVSADIMKQVNGVEQELDEVVNTVEEYASVVANVVVTIVKQSFLYKFIELLIALISLFLYFQDIISLMGSLREFFNGLFTGKKEVTWPQPSIDFGAMAAPHLGQGNDVMTGLGTLDTSSVTSEITKSLIDAISGNPLTKKILNKLMSLISEALSATNPQLPFSFSLDESVAQEAIDDVANLASQLVQALEGVTVQAIEDLANDVAADIANPQLTFSDLADQLGQLVAGIETTLLQDLFNLIDTVTHDGPQLAHDVIVQDGYITIDFSELADLCTLVGIGKPGSGKVTLSASEAIFFPLAAIGWVAIYVHEGKSITSVDELNETVSLADIASGTLGAVDTTRWNLFRIGADAILQELIGFVWLVNESTPGASAATAEKIFIACGPYFGLMRWANDLSYQTSTFVKSTPTVLSGFDLGHVAFRTFTAALNVVLTLPGKNLNQGAGWETLDPKPTDITQLMNFIATTSALLVDSIDGAESKPNEAETAALVGKAIFRTQLVFLFFYNFFTLESLIEEFTLLIFGAPAAGAFTEEIALHLASPGPVLGDDSKPTHCAGGRGTEHGKKTRTRKRPFGQTPNGPKD